MFRCKTIFLIATLALPGLQPLQSSTESCFDDFGLGFDFEADTPEFSTAISGTPSKDLFFTANDSYNPDDSTNPFNLVFSAQSTPAAAPPSEEAIESPTQPAARKKPRTAKPMLAVAAPAPACASTAAPTPHFASASFDPEVGAFSTAHQQAIARKKAFVGPSVEDDDSEDDDADCNDQTHHSSQRAHRKHSHIGKKTYTCDVCGQAFTQSSVLTIHKRTHTGEKPFSCKVCGKKFATRTKLTIHQRTHTGEKPFSCDVCDKSFATSSQLTRHKRTHTGDKPYTCDDCGRTFTHANTLTQHKHTHTGEKPYTCDTCGKSCTQLANLKRHQRTHTGEKPYKCDTCGKSFAQSSDLTRHKKSMH